MKNLAGLDFAEANRAVLTELALGVSIVARPEPKGEVRSQYIGVLRFRNGLTVTFDRAWVYWVAKCEPPITAPDCHTINEYPGEFVGNKFVGNKYSGDPSTLGGVVRANGFAGGMNRDGIARWGDRVESYDIDTLQGLAEFVSLLKRLYGDPLPEESCRVEARCGQ